MMLNLFRQVVLAAATTAASCAVYELMHKYNPFRRAADEALDPYEDVVAKNIVNPDNIDVTFGSIGGYDELKQELYDLLILPLKRPELFSSGILVYPQRGVLLYGPPGNGKTMFAKAIAKESGAVFVNVSLPNLMTDRFGESQKLVAALFALAKKLQPTIIFIDEVDGLLGRRRSTEHEALTRMKTEFLSQWDGFTTDRLLSDFYSEFQYVYSSTSTGYHADLKTLALL